MENFNDIFNEVNETIVPKLQTLLVDNCVLIGIVLFLLLMVLIGWKKGFILKLVSLGSVILTIAAEIKLFPMIVKFMQENETARQSLLDLGRSVLNIGSETTASPLYNVLGLDALAQNTGDVIGMIAAKVLCFIVIFIVVRVLLWIVAVMAKWIKKIRLFDSIDKLLGGILGAAEGIIYVWLFMFAVSGFPKWTFCRFVLDQIMNNQLLLEIYNQNLLIIFIADVLK